MNELSKTILRIGTKKEVMKDWKKELKKKSFQLAEDSIELIKLSDAVKFICPLLKQVRIDENKMYYDSMTSVYYDDMNKDSENTVWLKIRNLFEQRISELEKEK